MKIGLLYPFSYFFNLLALHILSMWLLGKAFPDWATQKAFHPRTNLAFLCRRKADMLEKLTLSDYKGSTLSKNTDHKETEA